MHLTLDIFVDGTWQHAATLIVAGAAHGTRSELAYEADYVLDHDPCGSAEIIDRRALSVRYPVGFEWKTSARWPAFVLDFLPQGHARNLLARGMGIDPDLETSDLPLLLRAGGAPIGNIRVREAWEQERQRVDQAAESGRLTIEDVFARNERFREVTEVFGAAGASGSSGVQGAWPKILLTQSADGFWYPDSIVPDQDARDHAIVKWVGDTHEETRLIIAAEAPYLEVARWFGLRCARPLRHGNGTLMMPRFDRRAASGAVHRLGQESLVAAAGFAAFGHVDHHETYLDVIRAVSRDPASDITEYVLRDLLNLAMGNPDNHGRNTAFQKGVDGGVWLSPLFDFCPMRLSRDGVMRSTKWACMQRPGGGTGDLDPDWDKVCEAAAHTSMPSEALKRTVAGTSEKLAALPAVAREKGVPRAVIERAMGRCAELSRAVGTLGG
jgi:serine/threonine-protein kinase HipA